MNKKYFTEATEQAIHDYLNSTGRTRQHIYNNVLHPAFVIMTESIINRYFFGIHDEDEFDEIKYSAIGHLLKKLNRFDPKRAKAFSYCQTIIKNHCNDFFKFRKQRGERYIPTDYESLVMFHDRPVEDDNRSNIDSMFGFIDYLLTVTGFTGSTQLSLPVIQELKNIKQTCLTVGSPDYGITKITAFHKKVFADRVTGWRQMNLLKEEFKEFMRTNNLN